MVRRRENTQKHLTRHAVTTLLMRAALPVTTARTYAVVVIAVKGKEAAP